MRTMLILPAMLSMLGGCVTAELFLPEDTTPPVVVAVYPVDGMVGAFTNTRIEIRFDDTIDPASLAAATIVLRPTNGGPVVNVRRKAVVSGTNVHLYFDPLAPDTTYAVRLSAGGLRNTSKLALAAGWDGKFTTGTTGTFYEPVFLVTSHTNDQAVRGVVKLRGTSANLLAVRFSVNGGLYQDFTREPPDAEAWSSVDSVANGYFNTAGATWNEGVTNTIDFELHPMQGDITYTNLRLVVDNTKPLISIAALPTSIESNYQFSGAVSEKFGLQSVYCSVDGGASNAAAGMAAWSFLHDTRNLADGPHALTVRVRDLAGNVATTNLVFRVTNWHQAFEAPNFSSAAFGFAVTNGTARLAYRDFAFNDTRIGTWTGSGPPSYTTVDTDISSGTHVDLAVDSAGNPAMGNFYWNYSLSVYHLAGWVAGAKRTLVPSTTGNYALQPSVAWEGPGRAMMAYLRRSPQPGYYKLAIARFTATGHTNYTNASFGPYAETCGAGPSIAVENSGQFHVAYYNETGRTVKHAQFTVSGGTLTVSGTTTIDTGNYGNVSGNQYYESGYYQTRLVVEASSHRHVAYMYRPNGGTYQLRYSKYAGYWPATIVDTHGTERICAPDLKVFRSVPYISYRKDGDLYLARINGPANRWLVRTDAARSTTRLSWDGQWLYLAYATTGNTIRVLRSRVF